MTVALQEFYPLTTSSDIVRSAINELYDMLLDALVNEKGICILDGRVTIIETKNS